MDFITKYQSTSNHSHSAAMLRASQITTRLSSSLIRRISADALPVSIRSTQSIRTYHVTNVSASTSTSTSTTAATSAPKAKRYRKRFQNKSLNIRDNEERQLILSRLNELLDLGKLAQFNELYSNVLERIDFERASVKGIYEPGFEPAVTEPETAPTVADTPDDEISKLINLSLRWNNAIIPSLLLLKDTTDVSRVSESTLQKVVNSLLLKDPLYEDMDLKLLQMILSKYEHQIPSLKPFQMSQLFDKFQGYPKLDVAKQIITMLQPRFSNKSIKIRSLNELIRIDSKLNNPAACYSHFQKLLSYQGTANTTVSQLDPRILRVLLKTFNTNHKFTHLTTSIVSQLEDSQLANPLYVDQVLRTLTRNNDTERLNVLITELSSPGKINKQTLSLLLRINLTFANFQNVEVIVNKLLTEYTLDETDYCIIVKSLLKRHKFQDAMVFVRGIPQRLKNASYITMIDHIVTSRTRSQLSDENRVIINGLCEDIARDEANDEFWCLLSPIYFKYRLRLVFDVAPLREIQELYEISTKDFGTGAITTDKNPFKIDNDDEQENGKVKKVIVSDSSKTVILKNILDKAISLKSTVTINWACLNLLELGFSKKDLKIDVYKKLDSRFISEIDILMKNAHNNQPIKRIGTKKVKFLEKREFLESQM